MPYCATVDVRAPKHKCMHVKHRLELQKHYTVHHNSILYLGRTAHSALLADKNCPLCGDSQLFKRQPPPISLRQLPRRQTLENKRCKTQATERRVLRKQDLQSKIACLNPGELYLADCISIDLVLLSWMFFMGGSTHSKDPGLKRPFASTSAAASCTFCQPWKRPR